MLTLLGSEHIRNIPGDGFLVSEAHHQDNLEAMNMYAPTLSATESVECRYIDGFDIEGEIYHRLYCLFDLLNKNSRLQLTNLPP